MPPTNTQILLARRPSGWPDDSTFEIRESPIPEPRDGEVLVRTHYLSLDPYMRGRMNDAKSYAAKVELGDVMVAAAVGEVLESHHPKVQKGDFVVGGFGWQEYAIASGAGMYKVDPNRIPLSARLGVAGMPGVTAYVGLFDIGVPKKGETVCVSAATGAVGSVVGQLAKTSGCRVVGIAGGTSKCDLATREFGFDACIDYKSADFATSLAAAVPNGIDVYFDNVGGEILDRVLTLLNPFARIPLCGFISQYNASTQYGMKNLIALLVSRAKLEGFIVSDRMARWPEALAHLEAQVASGALRYRETIAQGIRSAPQAFIGMLRGENIGKQVVKLV